MTVSADRFRDVLGRLAGGVCVVTARGRSGRPRGLTATAVCSVSLDPPLVLSCLARDSRTHRAIEISGHYAVNFLGAGDRQLAKRFAGDAEDKFSGLEPTTGRTGAPLLPTALGFCDCVVVDRLLAGDHTVFIGRVEAAGTLAGVPAGTAPPLLRYRGSYATVGKIGDAEGEASGDGD
jgi:flavin reductase (DIM6/NTAB) family NADH-FMN oxidoreductase RutF